MIVFVSTNGGIPVKKSFAIAAGVLGLAAFSAGAEAKVPAKPLTPFKQLSASDLASVEGGVICNASIGGRIIYSTTSGNEQDSGLMYYNGILHQMWRRQSDNFEYSAETGDRQETLFVNISQVKTISDIEGSRTILAKMLINRGAGQPVGTYNVTWRCSM